MAATSDSGMLHRLGCVEFKADFESFGIIEISLTVTDVLGYRVEECSRRGFMLDRLIHPDDVALVAARIMDAFEAEPVEFRFRAVRRDGSTVDMRALLAPCEPDETGRPCFEGLIHEHRAGAESSDLSEQRLQLALDSADMGVWDWRLSEWTIFWSDHVFRLHGTTREEVGDLFENYHSIVDRIHPEDLPALERIVMRALRAGEDYAVEYRVNLPDGARRWIHVRGRMYFGEDGRPARIAGTAQDITARKTAEIAAQRELAERRRAEEQLTRLTETLEERVRERTSELERANAQLRQEVAERVRAERELERLNRQLVQSNRELQDFAHVASHDLREPLRKITTFGDLLKAEHAEHLHGEGLVFLERMQHAAERMTHLIEGLLQFSRVRSGGEPFARIDLNDIVRDVLSDLEIGIEEVDGRVRVQNLPGIDADPTQMRQLFQNLISNALKFRRADVVPVIEIEATTLDRDHASDEAGYRLLVKDNGIGLDERYAERIFAPFQRLRPEYDGTGMGLAICRRIVERHGGTIAVDSTPGEGTTFTIDLPVRQRNAG